ncbi:MAG: hypothetical protein L0Y78_07095 [candidate division NC10 bacterium]|nr:hypothetical protein [candidate division NC10 bacterium]
MRQVLAVMVTFGLLALTSPSWAGSASEEGTLGQVGTGVGSVVGSAVYFPFKAAFCILGGIGSGFTLLAAGPESANKVASASCRGTWVITPDVVKGKETVHFVGEPSPSPQTKEARVE